MNKRAESIALAEQEVAEARMAVLAECRAARANLNRRAATPAFIGGVLVSAMVLGYFAAGRSKARPAGYREGAGAWSRAASTVRVLLPLLLAFKSATRKPACTSRKSGI